MRWLEWLRESWLTHFQTFVILVDTRIHPASGYSVLDYAMCTFLIVGGMSPATRWGDVRYIPFTYQRLPPRGYSRPTRL